MRLDAFRSDLRMFGHVFEDGRGTGMFETHIKDGRDKVAMEFVRPGKALRPSSIRLFGFLASFGLGCDGRRGRLLLLFHVLLLLRGAGSFPP